MALAVPGFAQAARLYPGWPTPREILAAGNDWSIMIPMPMFHPKKQGN